MTETPSEFARRLGVNKSTVCRAIQEGRLLASGGKLDVADNLRRWEATKPGTRADVAARHAAKRVKAIPLVPGAKTTPQNAITAVEEVPGIADYRKAELPRLAPFPPAGALSENPTLSAFCCATQCRLQSEARNQPNHATRATEACSAMLARELLALRRTMPYGSFPTGLLQGGSACLPGCAAAGAWRPHGSPGTSLLKGRASPRPAYPVGADSD
jgi:hypothetical protein